MPAFLLPLLLGLAPVVADMFGSGTKDVVTKVTGIAKEVLGVDSLDGVERAITTDPAKALEFKMALIAAATEEKRLIVEAETKARQSQIDELRILAENVQSARSMAMSKTPLAWGSIIMSVLVLGLSLAVAYLILWPTPESAKWTETIVTMLAGAAIGWVNTVLNFWLGSSMGSHNKDASLAELKSLIIKKP